MGTSKGYEAPSTPQWGKLKGDVTRAAGGGSATPEVARTIIGSFLQANGGAGGITQGGRSGSGSRAAQSVAGRFADLINSVSNRGLSETLQNNDLINLVGKSATDISYGLLDFLCDDGSTLDEVDARNAMDDIIKDLLMGASSYEDVQQKLEERLQIGATESLLIRFFGYYIYRRFCHTFYESITAKHGEQKGQGFLSDIKRCIDEELRFKTFGKKVTNIDWLGNQGQSLIDEILQDTVAVFGG